MLSPRVASSEFEDQKWDQYNDLCAIKTFHRTENAVGKVFADIQ